MQLLIKQFNLMVNHDQPCLATSINWECCLPWMLQRQAQGHLCLLLTENTGCHWHHPFNVLFSAGPLRHGVCWCWLQMVFDDMWGHLGDRWCRCCFGWSCAYDSEELSYMQGHGSCSSWAELSWVCMQGYVAISMVYGLCTRTRRKRDKQGWPQLVTRAPQWHCHQLSRLLWQNMFHRCANSAPVQS